VKRYWLVIVGALVASITIFSSSASGQEPTTTLPEEPTTTTEFIPPPDDPTTTIDVPAPTSTIPPMDLPGEYVIDGSMTLGSRFQEMVQSNCQAQGSLGGQEMNLVRNETGNIGGVYGKADIGGSSVGLVMVQLGPLPTAVVAYRATGTCEQDVVGIGGYGATPTTARFEGIGFGAFPGDFAEFVTVDVTVSQAGGEPSLDLQAAYDFLAAPR
jgi:hypothetical protein